MGLIAMKRYVTILWSPKLEPHHQVQFSVIRRIFFSLGRWVCRGYNQHIIGLVDKVSRSLVKWVYVSTRKKFLLGLFWAWVIICKVSLINKYTLFSLSFYFFFFVSFFFCFVFLSKLIHFKTKDTRIIIIA